MWGREEARGKSSSESMMILLLDRVLIVMGYTSEVEESRVSDREKKFGGFLTGTVREERSTEKCLSCLSEAVYEWVVS